MERYMQTMVFPIQHDAIDAICHKTSWSVGDSWGRAHHFFKPPPYFFNPPVFFQPPIPLL